MEEEKEEDVVEELQPRISVSVRQNVIKLIIDGGVRQLRRVRNFCDVLTNVALPRLNVQGVRKIIPILYF